MTPQPDQTRSNPPPAYVRPYLADHEHRHQAPGEKPRTRCEPGPAGLRALLDISRQQERDTNQDRELADLIRGLIAHRPDLAGTQTTAPRPLWAITQGSIPGRRLCARPTTRGQGPPGDQALPRPYPAPASKGEPG